MTQSELDTFIADAERIEALEAKVAELEGEVLRLKQRNAFLENLRAQAWTEAIK